jgi:hypothetical protein
MRISQPDFYELVAVEAECVHSIQLNGGFRVLFAECIVEIRFVIFGMWKFDVRRIDVFFSYRHVIDAHVIIFKGYRNHDETIR